MKTLSLAVFIACATFALAKQPLIIRDCSNPENAYIQVLSAKITPDPVPIPGNLKVSGSLRVNKPAKGAQIDVELTIQKYVGILYVTVPCISNVGSCTLDVCKLLSVFESTSCPPQLVSNNIPCTCDTIVPGDYSIQDETFVVPELSGVWTWLASGDYKIDVKLRDRNTKQEVGCLHVEGTIVDPNACEGFLCSIFG